jgi:hypothetical protein
MSFAGAHGLQPENAAGTFCPYLTEQVCLGENDHDHVSGHLGKGERGCVFVGGGLPGNCVKIHLLLVHF